MKNLTFITFQHGFQDLPYRNNAFRWHRLVISATSSKHRTARAGPTSTASALSLARPMWSLLRILRLRHSYVQAHHIQPAGHYIEAGLTGTETEGQPHALPRCISRRATVQLMKTTFANELYRRYSGRIAASLIYISWLRKPPPGKQNHVSALPIASTSMIAGQS